MSLKVVAIVQARVNSTRLPRKVLLPFIGKPMLWHILERVKRATKVDHVICAMPKNDYYELRPAIPEGVDWIACDINENDLVQRHLMAAKATDADIIARIPSDNPCVEPDYVDMAVKLALSEPVPFYTNTTARSGEQFVDGIGAEVYTFSTLQWLDQYSDEREHPHKYFDRHMEYRLPHADVRLDVNTQADYDFIAGIYQHFGHNRFTVEEVLDYLDSQKEAAHVQA